MPRRRWLGGIVAVWALWSFGARPNVAEEVPIQDDSKQKIEVAVVSAGSSSAAARKKSISELPLDLVNAELRAKVDDVIKNVSLFRRMPTLSFVTEPDVYQFFVGHPDVAVSIWRVMEISTFELWQTGPVSFEADSHDGSTGTVEVLHNSATQHLTLCEGAFKSPLLLKPIKARALLHLQPKFVKQADGQTVVTHTLDMFVSFPSQPVDITAKLISPVSHAMADRNFREVSLWCAMMNVAMCQQPGWFEQLAQKLDGVLEVRRSQLMKLAAQSYVANRKRMLENKTAGHEVSLDEITATIRKAASDRSSESANGTIQVSGEKKEGSSRVEPASGKMM